MPIWNVKGIPRLILLSNLNKEGLIRKAYENCLTSPTDAPDSTIGSDHKDSRGSGL